VRQLSVKGWALYMTSGGGSEVCVGSGGSSCGGGARQGSARRASPAGDEVGSGAGAEQEEREREREHEEDASSLSSSPPNDEGEEEAAAAARARIPAEDYLVPPVDAALRIVVRDGPPQASPTSPRAAAAPSLELDVQIGAGGCWRAPAGKGCRSAPRRHGTDAGRTGWAAG
jgi:hypothetical protein